MPALQNERGGPPPPGAARKAAAQRHEPQELNRVEPGVEQLGTVQLWQPHSEQAARLPGAQAERVNLKHLDDVFGEMHRDDGEVNVERAGVREAIVRGADGLKCEGVHKGSLWGELRESARPCCEGVNRGGRAAPAHLSVQAVEQVDEVCGGTSSGLIGMRSVWVASQRALSRSIRP